MSKVLGAVVAGLLLSAAGAAERERDLEGWVPALAPHFGMIGQKASGAVTTGNVLGPPLPTGCNDGSPDGKLCDGSPLKLTPDTHSSDTGVAPIVGGSLELMSPRLFDGLLSPRWFAHADFAWAFSFERNLAGERKPGPLVAPELEPTLTNIPEIAIVGQGSRAKSQLRPLVVSAGTGIAFTLVIFERTLRLKPSFEYLRQEVDLLGSVRRAVKLRDPARKEEGLSSDSFRLITLSRSEVETQHALGAGIEIEADTGRLGPLLLSMFIGGRGYRLLGNLERTLTTTNEFGELARWDFEFERYAWRSDAGIRFRWVPE